MRQGEIFINENVFFWYAACGMTTIIGYVGAAE